MEKYKIQFSVTIMG